MITEEQKQDIQIDIETRVNEWVSETLALKKAPHAFMTLHSLFIKAEIDWINLPKLSPLEILEATIKACKKIGMSNIETSYAVDNWACDASKLFGLTQDGYPECWR